MKKKKIILNVCLAVALILLGAFSMFYLVTEKGTFGQTVINKLEKEVTINENGIADAVEKLYDAVVVVNAQSKQGKSSGTGFVYKKDNKTAYILTNNHVISGATDVSVKFTNNKEYDVKVVGTDSFSDIAVLSVDAKNIIKVASLGKSENLRLGDTLFTIGAPLKTEYSWTVTRGILSGKDRLVEVNASNYENSDWVMKVIQTDAAINSGNSGGPLANSNGEVIGITNMKLINSGIEGMGFAIPMEDATLAAEALIANKKIARPLLGVGTLNADDVESMIKYGFVIDSSITSGAVVGYVQKGSPAEDAKLEKGDVIIKFGDYRIDNSAYLKYYLYKYNVGDKVKMTIIRGKKEISLTIKLSESA